MRSALLLLVAACAALSLAGCTRTAETAVGVAPAAPAAPRASLPATPAASVESAVTTESGHELLVGNKKDADGFYLCPVKGIPMKDLSKAQHVIHEGVWFYVDCPGSKAKFEKNADAYLSGEIQPKDCGGKRECETDLASESQAAKH